MTPEPNEQPQSSTWNVIVEYLYSWYDWLYHYFFPEPAPKLEPGETPIVHEAVRDEVEVQVQTEEPTPPLPTPEPLPEPMPETVPEPLPEPIIELVPEPIYEAIAPPAPPPPPVEPVYAPAPEKPAWATNCYELSHVMVCKNEHTNQFKLYNLNPYDLHLTAKYLHNVTHIKADENDFALDLVGRWDLSNES